MGEIALLGKAAQDEVGRLSFEAEPGARGQHQGPSVGRCEPPVVPVCHRPLTAVALTHRTRLQVGRARVSGETESVRNCDRTKKQNSLKVCNPPLALHLVRQFVRVSTVQASASRELALSLRFAT